MLRNLFLDAAAPTIVIFGEFFIFLIAFAICVAAAVVIIHFVKKNSAKKAEDKNRKDEAQ